LKIENLKLKIKSGFTMIEILIVIAVLGILAVAVLSAIIRSNRSTEARIPVSVQMRSSLFLRLTDSMPPPVITPGGRVRMIPINML